MTVLRMERYLFDVSLLLIFSSIYDEIGSASFYGCKQIEPHLGDKVQLIHAIPSHFKFIRLFMAISVRTLCPAHIVEFGLTPKILFILCAVGFFFSIFRPLSPPLRPGDSDLRWMKKVSCMCHY